MLLLLAALAACQEPVVAAPEERIESVTAPTPLTIGSPVTLEGTFELSGLSRTGDAVLFVIAEGVEYRFTPFTSVPLTFLATRDFVEAAGDQSVDVVLRLEGLINTLPFDVRWDVARAPQLELDNAPSGGVHYNDPLVLRGNGFHGPTEGELFFCAEGTFVSTEGAEAVSECQPATLVDPTERDRALTRLSVRFGSSRGLEGDFDGIVFMESRREELETRRSAPRAASFRFGLPEVFGLSPSSAPLEARVIVEGAGFLGGVEDASDANTVVTLSGLFSYPGGEEPIDAELVPRFVSGTELEWTLRSEVNELQLVSTLFGQGEGRFEGQMQVALIATMGEVTSVELPIAFELTPVRQAVWLRFLPQFGTSLERFGLRAAETRIREAIAARVEELYRDFRVDVFLNEPAGVSPSGVTTIDIGGPDPSGLGIFGRDNSPGKDVGNIRLFDAIGGLNADVQTDGFAGYGGVFVESYLWWSSHPELSGPRPIGAPQSEALFDTLFDAVRRRPITLAESRGEGDVDRNEVAGRALRAFSYMSAETVAHELGHALGLAQPFGAPTDFHNPRDEPGCLMDAARDRPLGERVAEPGFEGTHFCEDATLYLEAILGG
ncbi:MAG: hypothetical protein AB8H86_01915 [Polyangiales bacterium]